jgi:hypothetical protein
MKTEQKCVGSINFSGNDDLYPTEVVFPNGCKVRLACSEDGQVYLRVEYGALLPERLTSPNRAPVYS